MRTARLALAQVNPTVGALDENGRRIVSAIAEARDGGADLVLLPELAITGYPPEDLLGNPEFIADARHAVERILPHTTGIAVVVGLPLLQGDTLYNAAALLIDGRWVDSYAKVTLPNYGVFDEKRYFRPGLRCPVYRMGDLRFGVHICEDIWTPGGVPKLQAETGAQLLLNLSASPYYAMKGLERETLLRHRARQLGVAIAYVNLVGGQDELLFDGESLLVDASGVVRARAPQFREALLLLDLEPSWLVRSAESHARDGFVQPGAESISELEGRIYADVVTAPEIGEQTKRPLATLCLAPRLSEEAEVYAALTLGVGDYVRKNGFACVVLGLSGGIDSALTAAIASDAIGPKNVLAVSMPSRWNSETSKAGARDTARLLGLEFLEIPIESAYLEAERLLAPRFAGSSPGVTEENLQARIRAVLLMALSNKEGRLLLTTGNKSELAVGYCTLYGDMAGGFAPLKDVPKTLIYRIARYRNSLGDVIPEDTLTRPPSAELRANQTDQDTLPPYDLLDRIVEAKVEREASPESLVEEGIDPAWVERVYRWIDQSEYKRRQAAPGIKITPRAFGRDRRYPITNQYRWTHPASAEETFES